jgi:hypothetical protein
MIGEVLRTNESCYIAYIQYIVHDKSNMMVDEDSVTKHLHMHDTILDLLDPLLPLKVQYPLQSPSDVELYLSTVFSSVSAEQPLSTFSRCCR